MGFKWQSAAALGTCMAVAVAVRTAALSPSAANFWSPLRKS